MNRRSLFSFFAAAPFAAAAIRDVAITPSAAATVEPQHPVGFVLDTYEYHPSPYTNTFSTAGIPSHTHTLYASEMPVHTHGYTPVYALPRRKIWDGGRFVDFDGPDGAAVLNRVLTGKA